MNFLLDSGSSGALITGELRDVLGLSPTDGQVRVRTENTCVWKTT